MSGSEQAQALLGAHELSEIGIPLEVVLDRVQRLVDARRAWENGLPDGEWQDHSRRWDAFRDAQDDFEAVGISAAFLLTHLLSENAALAAENARLQAQAGAVAGLVEQWTEDSDLVEYAWAEEKGTRADCMRARVATTRAAVTQLQEALAQASAEGEAGAEGVG